MPPYRVRSKRGPGRQLLTDAERIELCIGQASDRPSLFRDALDYARAAELLEAELATRVPLAHLSAARPILAELRRRHFEHFAHDDDPEYPAVFDAIGCERCNPLRYDPLSLREEDLRAPVPDLEEDDR